MYINPVFSCRVTHYVVIGRAAPIPNFTDTFKYQVLLLNVFTSTSTDTDT